MPAIHLIEKLGLEKPIIPEAKIYESGIWDVHPSKAQKLVGGDLYLHLKQLEPSRFGGKILGFRVQNGGQYDGRIIFILQSTPEHVGISTAKAGWSVEMKYEWDKSEESEIPATSKLPPANYKYAGIFNQLQDLIFRLNREIERMEAFYRGDPPPFPEQPFLDLDEYEYKPRPIYLEQPLRELESLIYDIRAALKPIFGSRLEKLVLDSSNYAKEFWIVHDLLGVLCNEKTNSFNGKEYETFLDEKAAKNKEKAIHKIVHHTDGGSSVITYHVQKNEF